MNRKYWYWINNIEGIGNAKIRHLLDFAGTPEHVYSMSKKELLQIDSLSEKDINNIISDKNKSAIFEEY